MALVIEKIQRGSVTMTTGANVTATISAVVLAKSILIFSTEADTGDPDNGMLSGKFNSTTQLSFSNNVNSTNIINWQVVEFTSGSSINVQHFSLTTIGDGDTQTITSVGDITNAYAIYSATSSNIVMAYDDLLFARINSTTQVTFDLANTPGTLNTVELQVIDSTDLTVQQINATFGTGSLTKDNTITAVTIARTYMEHSVIMDNTWDFSEASGASLTSTTNLRWTKAATNRTQTNLTYVIQIDDTDWAVASYTSSMSTTETTDAVTITAVDMDNTWVQIPHALNKAAIVTSGNDNFKSSMVRAELTSTTNIDIDRDSTGSDPADTELLVLEYTPVTGQTVSPTGIASGEAFGTAVLTTGNVTVTPTGIASGEAFGTAVLTTGNVSVSPTGIASGEAFGTAVLTTGNVNVTPTGIASGEAFGTAVLTTGNVNVTPTGIASGEAFGNPELKVMLSPTGIASGEAFGTAVLTTGNVSVSPTGIASGEAFGTAVLTTGNVTVTPTGIASGEAFGTAVLTTGNVSVSPTGIASGEAFGTAVLTTGNVNVTPTGIASGEAFGTAVLSLSGVTVTPTGIASGEAFGTAVLTTGNVNVTPTGIASGEAFGTAVLVNGVTLSPTGIASGEAFGTAVLTTGNVSVSPTGIASGEAFGTAVLTTGNVSVSPTGIASGEAFGTAVLSVGAATVSPTGIASGEAFGTAVLTTGNVNVTPTGIASGEAFGVVDVSSNYNVSPAGIVSAEAFGTPVFSVGNTNISPAGIASAEAFGVTVVENEIKFINPDGIESGEGFGNAELILIQETGSKVFAIFRKALEGTRRLVGSYVNGKYVQGAEVDFTFTASVQVISGDEQETLPEGLRERGVYVLFTDYALRAENQTTKAPGDYITLESKLYKVIRVEPWKNRLVPHYKAIISEFENVA